MSDKDINIGSVAVSTAIENNTSGGCHDESNGSNDTKITQTERNKFAAYLEYHALRKRY